MKEKGKAEYYYEQETGKLFKYIGSNHSKGYIHFRHNGKNVYAHRYIWEMFNPKIEKGMTVDHINHNKQDNRISNLRLVSNDTNHKNMPLASSNKSGVSGVYFSKRSKKWIAQININKKSTYLGSYKLKDAAIAARKQAEGVYNYHPNHGQVI